MNTAPSTPLKTTPPSPADPLALAAVPYGERVLASSAYLGALAGLWLILPAALYFWKSRQSRFIGFHAIQAMLLQVALIPVLTIGVGVSGAVAIAITMANDKLAPLASIVSSVLLGLTFMAPVAMTLWLGLCALRGQPRSLPLLGRMARRVSGEI
jgi:uncharacterized membrane protein